MRKEPLVNGLYYHIYNRGVDKRDIFSNKKDLERFVNSVKYFNDTEPVGHLTDVLLNKKNTNLPDVQRREESKKLVSVVCYCFNPNHFHFILKQEVDNGISEFFKRLLGGYTKYFNSINERSGALFQGRFKSKLIDDDAYFLKIRPYVHLNHLLHDIPKEKKDLVLSSEREYNTNNFELVDQKEAQDLLDFYGGNDNFKKEAMDVVLMIREERGLISLFDKDSLP